MPENKLSVHIDFDTLNFYYPDVPEKKYENYLKMRHVEADPECLNVDGFPYMLQLEPTNLCNLKCPVCPAGTNKLQRKRRSMPINEYRAIVDDVQDYLLLLILWEWGEPFMHPDLPEMIQYAADKGIKTVTSTNAHFLEDEEYLERILTSGLSSLIIAIDSLDQERYEVYRVGGKLSFAVEGVRRVVEMKRKLGSDTLINLRMVIMKQNEHELPAIRKFAKDVGVDIFTVKTMNPGCGLGTEEVELVPANEKYRRYKYHEGTFERIMVETHCRKMWFMCSIFADGEVVPCGYDFDARMIVGNVNKVPLTSLWNSPEAKKVREMIYHQQQTHPLCKDCTVNFKLSNGGWFPESIDFNKRLFSKSLEAMKDCYDSSPVIRNNLSKAPFLKKSLTRLWSFAHRA